MASGSATHHVSYMARRSPIIQANRRTGNVVVTRAFGGARLIAAWRWVNPGLVEKTRIVDRWSEATSRVLKEEVTFDEKRRSPAWIGRPIRILRFAEHPRTWCRSSCSGLEEPSTGAGRGSHGRNGAAAIANAHSSTPLCVRLRQYPGDAGARKAGPGCGKTRGPW